MSAIYRIKSESSNDSAGAKSKLAKRINHKVLVLCSRGIVSRQRHLLEDLIALLPHSKKDAKFDSKSNLKLLNELAELYNCDQILFFEARRHQDLYTWLSCAPNGPCIKLFVQNLHTMNELNMTGNCLKGSRPILSFDKKFESAPHWKVAKQALTNTFAVPKGARRAKPFVDHIITFTIADDKIWFRNYQIILKRDGKSSSSEITKGGAQPDMSLIEIGPRFVMTIVTILEGSFGGPVIYKNEDYVSTSAARAAIKRMKAQKLTARLDAKIDKETRKPEETIKPDPTEISNILRSNKS